MGMPVEGGVLEFEGIEGRESAVMQRKRGGGQGWTEDGGLRTKI